MLKIGELFQDKYLILQQLGKGGSSIVYLAKYQNTFYAIKEIKEEYKEGGMNEGRILQLLKHPHIVELKEYVMLERIYLILEYISDLTLEQYLISHHKKDEMLQFALELSQVLGYIHQMGYIYRDLKPANIMIKDGHIKLIDFGIVRKYKKQPDTTLLGTRGYCAPEIERVGKTTYQSDLYSLGITLAMMFTGKMPRDGKVELSDQELKGIIERCLKEKMEERYQSCEEIIRDLKKYEKRRKRKCNYRLKLWS